MFKEFAVIDFETTGLSADYCRVIEVAAVIVRNGEVADSFVELMHPGCRLPFIITDITGITDAMLKGKPKPEAVMQSLKDFTGDRHCMRTMPLSIQGSIIPRWMASGLCP